MVRVPSILLLAVVIPAVARSGKAADPRPGEDPLSARTFYLSIPLGVPAVDDPATGVYLPEKYTAGDTIDLVLFLRGYDVKRPKSATAVREYWGSSKHPVLKSFLFREEIDRSGKNVVLVVPPLGPFSEAGKLVQAGGVQAFLDGVVAGLAKHGPFVGRKHPPKVRHLILAAHSGGGVPLRRLAQELGRDDRFRDKLTACWGFDSIYGVRDKDAEFWADWAKDHPKTQIRMYYLFTQRAVGKDPKRPVGADNPVDHREPSGTSGPALDLERLAKARSLANVAVVRDTKATTLDHNEVPRTHLSDLLKLTTCLDTR
ncbi:MAG TPA: hypothetical protein VGJ05_17020 [Fimbriiglobus sp.]